METRRSTILALLLFLLLMVFSGGQAWAWGVVGVGGGVPATGGTNPARWYFSNAAASYTPATIRGGWDATGDAIVKKLGGKSGAYATIGVAETSDVSGYSSLNGRWVSDGLVAPWNFTTGGTLAISLGAFESSNSANAYVQCYIYVTQGDSDTPRGVLFEDTGAAGSWDSGTEFSSVSAGSIYGSVSISNNVSAQIGDRIVVEIGWFAFQTSTTSYTGTYYYGGTDATDLAAADADTDVTSNPGWIEFSQ